MCNFLSAILMRDGTLHCAPEYTDSHETLLAAACIRDGYAQTDRFVRLEYLPPDDPTQLDQWTWRVDEPSAPDWLTDEVREDTERQLLSRVKRMLVTDERSTVLGGCWIICDGGRINRLVGGRIALVTKGANLVRANLDGANLDGAYRPTNPPAGWEPGPSGYLHPVSRSSEENG